MANNGPLRLRSSLKSPNSGPRCSFNVSFEDPYSLATQLLKSESKSNSTYSRGHTHALKVPPDSISFHNGSSIEEVTCPDIDDLLPKTDYTYARTSSYRRKYSEKVGSVSPNMSRRRVDGNMPMFISDDESEDGYEEEYDDEAIISSSRNFYGHQNSEIQNGLGDNVKESVKRRVSSTHGMGYTSTPVYPHDPYSISTHDHYYKGMLLRSGSHIRGDSRLKGFHESSTSSDVMSQDLNLGLMPTYRSDYDSKDSALKNRLRGSNRNVTTTTTTITTNTFEDYEDLTKESRIAVEDDEMKLKVDESQTEKTKMKKMPYVLHSLDGLDRDDEFSDYETIETDEINARRGMDLRRQQVNENFFYSIITTIITTIFTTTTTAAASVGSTAGSVGKILVKPVTIPASWMWRAIVLSCSWIVRQSATVLLIEMESKRRSRRGCCLCLIPLLLMLPLALLAGYYASDMKHHAYGFVSDSGVAISSMWAGLWSEEKERVVIPPPVTATSNGERQEMDMTRINNYIEQTILQMFVQHRQEIPPGMTPDQVRDIVQAMLSTQMGSKQTEIDSHIESVAGSLKGDISGLKSSLLDLQAQIDDAVRQTQAVASNVDETKANIQSMSSEQGMEWLAASQALESKLLDLRNDVNEVVNKNTALAAMLKSCCQNDTALAATVRAHMTTILYEVGNDDKDSALAGLMAWMQENYVGRAELDKKLSLVAAGITENLQSLLSERVAAEVQKNGGNEIKASIVSASIDEKVVKSIVEEALVQFSADRVGMPDFALESAGGSVLSVRCSETYYRKTALVSVFGVPLYYASNSPRTVIQPNVHPGECWAFKGNSGFVVIQLSQPIQPTGFTLEHIPKSLSPSGTIDSAPKSFTILGLASEDDLEGISLGNFTYLDNGKPIQHFTVQNQHPGIFQFIELRVMSNHGNPEYTCIYRFRVHGLP